MSLSFIILWFICGAIAAAILVRSCLRKSDEVTFLEAFVALVLVLSGTMGLVLTIMLSVIFFFEEKGDDTFYKRKPKSEFNPTDTVQIKLDNGLYQVPVGPDGEPAISNAFNKCEHEQPCYRPECK